MGQLRMLINIDQVPVIYFWSGQAEPALSLVDTSRHVMHLLNYLLWAGFPLSTASSSHYTRPWAEISDHLKTLPQY